MAIYSLVTANFENVTAFSGLPVNGCNSNLGNRCIYVMAKKRS